MLITTLGQSHDFWSTFSLFVARIASFINTQGQTVPENLPHDKNLSSKRQTITAELQSEQVQTHPQTYAPTH